MTNWTVLRLSARDSDVNWRMIEGSLFVSLPIRIIINIPLISIEDLGAYEYFIHRTCWRY